MSVTSIHQFAEKVALISDAASPIGRAVAMQLALNGSYVIGLFREDGGSVDELVELGTLAHAVKADPSTLTGASEAADAVEKLFGRLDLLVNCLKFRPESSFENLIGYDFSETIDRNLGSVFYLTTAVFKLMNGRPKPRIVNVVSGADTENDPVFAASQAGILAWTRTLAARSPKNFRINVVEAIDDPAGEAGGSGLQLRANGSVAPDDIARSVLFLLSSESAAVNGQVIKLG